MNRRLRILVVDDSAYLRKTISQMVEESSFLEVVGTARDGRDALEKCLLLDPDVVTLDLNMPNMDGAEFLRAQMRIRPLAVVIVSVASEDGDLAARAIELGAVEMVRKPTGLASEKVLEIRQELQEKIIAAAGISRDKLVPYSQEDHARRSPLKIHRGPNHVDAVVLGLSTGGPQALRFLLSQWPSSFPVPLATVLHMPAGYTGPFARRLSETYELEVLEARDGLEMLAGRLILAQAGRHLKLRTLGGRVVCKLDPSPSTGSHRPSVDVLFQSASEVYGSRLVGAVFTGMGDDGKAGSAWIKAGGGKILAEAESSCIVYGMPRSVAEAGLADEIRPLDEMPQAILDCL